MVKNSKKFIFIAIIVIIAYLIPWILLALPHFQKDGLDLNNLKDIQYLVSLLVCPLSIATSFHLWSRVPPLEGQIRKLFLLTGVTFIVICGIFSYLIIDIILEWNRIPTLSSTLNSNIPAISFAFFGIESLATTMPADSFVTFSLILLAISFYLFPMEKYVKSQIPWHTYSMFACTAVLPILVLLVPRDFPGSATVMSLLTIIVVLWVLYNFVFLFYLYFSMGIKSPKGTAMRKASFMIGVGLLSIILTWILGWAINTGTPILDLAIQMASGGIGIALFNYGFYLIRPD
ncbi:MAG: hypothetical protein ACTSR8_00210 [Promethearchaeota archaeon]